MAGDNVEKGESLHTASENVNKTARIENSMDIPQKIKNRTSIWPNNPNIEFIFKGKKIIFSTLFVAVLSMTVKKWKQPECPQSDEWTKNAVAAHMEYYSAMKGWNLYNCRDMDGNWGYYVKWDKPSTMTGTAGFYLYKEFLQSSSHRS